MVASAEGDVNVKSCSGHVASNSEACAWTVGARGEASPKIVAGRGGSSEAANLHRLSTDVPDQGLGAVARWHEDVNSCSKAGVATTSVRASQSR